MRRPRYCPHPLDTLIDTLDTYVVLTDPFWEYQLFQAPVCCVAGTAQSVLPSLPHAGQHTGKVRQRHVMGSYVGEGRNAVRTVWSVLRYDFSGYLIDSWPPRGAAHCPSDRW